MTAEAIAVLESVGEAAAIGAAALTALAQIELREPDWTTTREHERAIAAVTRRIDTDADPAIDEDDVEQEARIYLALASERFRDLEPGYLIHELQRMTARELKIYGRQHQAALDELLEQAAVEHRASTRDFTSGWLSRPEPPEYEGKSYSPSRVEYVLPAIWDEEYGKGIPNPRAPAEGMPRGSSNPKTANTHLAMIADIKTAWHKAPVTPRQRAALFLRFGLQWPHEEIAAELGYADESGARYACDRGAQRLADFLNGTETEDDPEWEF